MVNSSIAKSVKLLEEVAEDTVEVTTPIIAISMFSAIVFGIIDAMSFVLAESALIKVLRTTGLFSEYTLLIAVNGISTAIALFVAVILEQYLAKYFTLFKSPYLDASGIIIGTILVIASIRFYNKIYPTPPKDPKKKVHRA